MTGVKKPMRDYYKTLGLPLNATPSAIKAAYHDLAREHHPDVAGGRAHSDQLIRDINQAYSVLGDPKLRRAYDAGRRHHAKDQVSRKYHMTTVGAVAAALTVCIGIAFVYALDRDFGFDEQTQTALRRADNADSAIEKAESEKRSEQLPRHARQPQQQVAEWSLATEDLPQTIVPRSTLPMNEREAGDPGSQTRNSETPSVHLPNADSQSRNSKSTMSQVRVEDRPERLPSRDVDLWDSKVQKTARMTPANPTENPSAREATAPGDVLGPANPAMRQKERPRIGQSWSKSWKLVARRWSPRFSIRYLRIDLDKHCAGCRWVKFAALMHDVRIHEARIHYSDGTSRKLNVSGTIEDGHATAPQKLGVRFARFSFISVTHQSPFNLKSGGWLAVYGIDDLGTDETRQMVSRNH